MADSAFVFHVPAMCPHCAKAGGVQLEHHVKGTDAVLTWCCRHCSHEWPVSPDDRVELRVKPDRRKTTRSDRRS